MKCSDPDTWLEPSIAHECEDAGYGAVRVRAWEKMHPKVRAHEGRGSREPLPVVVGTLILVEVERLPCGERRREPKRLWPWWADPEGTAPDLGFLWRAYVRRFDLEHTFRFLKHSDGTLPAYAILSGPTGGRGSSWPPSHNSGWRGRTSRTEGCPGRGATIPTA